ncbi:hypothetical protein [Enterococcus sp. AZ109]|uniref:hypothetical protein n=1 Tax=Enterococcus sp. AZ109 TaxID=2774634 RepID=UPI003F2480A8
MNKQELIERLEEDINESRKAVSKAISIRVEGYWEGTLDMARSAQTLVMKLDEPQKVKSASLNDNQQAILGWLTDCYKENGDPVTTVSDLYDETRPSEWKSCLLAAFEDLDSKQQFEVLAAFADWGLAEVSE